jgi:hypothetical protein
MLPRSTAFAVLLLLVTTGLAAQQRTVVAVPGYSVQVELDTLGLPHTVAASRARTFTAVVDAYRTLKIPLALVDSAGGRVGNWGYRKSGSMAGRQMSAWLSCGESMTGQIADEYRITLWIYTTVAARGADSVTVSSALVAGATSIEGASRQPMPCRSTGRLEARLHSLVDDWLAAHP